MRDSLVTLSVSCVYFDTASDIFRNTILMLRESCDYAKEHGLLHSIELHIINNNPGRSVEFLSIANNFQNQFDQLVIHNGHGNIGYGRGNNLAISSIQSDFHLILNPDVFIAKDNILNAIMHMQKHLNVDAVAADAFDLNNNRLYLAKRNPSIGVLLVRAVNHSFLNTLFQKQLYRYEYRDCIPNSSPLSIELMSGCYMFLRTQSAQTLGGFNPKYFLYFEDFDLSKRLSIKQLVFDVKIVHLGGNSSKKGIKHIIMFLKSMIIFKLS